MAREGIIAILLSLCMVTACGGERYDGAEDDGSAGVDPGAGSTPTGTTSGAAAGDSSASGEPGAPSDSPASDGSQTSDDAQNAGDDAAGTDTPVAGSGADAQPGAGDDPPASGGDDAPDCAPDDPWAGPGAEEICGDWVDDDCDGMDSLCPTTEASVRAPAWDCQGMPPESVLAWAPFAGETSSCGVIFAAADAFYFAPINVDATCPGSHQERLHAWSTTEAECEELLLVSYFDFDKPSDFSQYGDDFDYDQQPTSNACRKVLMYLAGDLEFSYVASSEAAVRERLALYPQLEVGCHAWTGTANFAPVELSNTPFMLNAGFIAPAP